MNTRHNDESGSILLAMMAIITIGALIAATFTVLQQSQKVTRRDRAYTEAIQVADAGLQQALGYFRTASNPLSATWSYNDAKSDRPTLDNSLGEGSFTWTATRSGADWEVRAQGTVDGVTRTIEAVVTRGQDLLLAAFGDLQVVMNGGSASSAGGFSVSSYDSSTNTYTDGGAAVGSNNDVDLNGNKSGADSLILYGPNATCKKTEVNAAGEEVCKNADQVISVKDERATAPLLAAADAEAKANCTFDGTTYYSDGGADNIYTPSIDGPLQAGETYCFKSMAIDVDMTPIANATTGATYSQDNPIRIYVENNVVVDQGVTFNCPDCTDESAGGLYAFEPGGLIVTMTGVNKEFKAHNHSEMGMLLNAPGSTCVSRGGAPLVVGSLLCQSIEGSGGWTMRFDENAANSGIGIFTISDWREEVGSSTSF